MRGATGKETTHKSLTTHSRGNHKAVMMQSASYLLRPARTRAGPPYEGGSDRRVAPSAPDEPAARGADREAAAERHLHASVLQAPGQRQGALAHPRRPTPQRPLDPAMVSSSCNLLRLGGRALVSKRRVVPARLLPADDRRQALQVHPRGSGCGEGGGAPGGAYERAARERRQQGAAAHAHPAGSTRRVSTHRIPRKHSAPAAPEQRPPVHPRLPVPIRFEGDGAIWDQMVEETKNGAL